MMRAKMQITTVAPSVFGNKSVLLVMSAVARNDTYPKDGSDENNTYAKFTPTANLEMVINNPALEGKFAVGQEFYVDFIEVPKASDKTGGSDESSEGAE